jgi:imidazolonepropionase-like amidohydrolase
MKRLIFCFLMLFCVSAHAQTDSLYLFKPARVFDGVNMHTGWVVLVNGNKIEAIGPMTFKLPATTIIIELPNATLMPGMIEGHSHLFLHPYNEVSWDDQVLRESRAERTARAVMHARATIMAGFTTTRDLGTEGAMYDDVGLRTAIEKGVIIGPRILAATRAIVAKGSYGPNYSNPDVDLPQGAAEVANPDEMAKEVYTEIGKGADIIKLYADGRTGLEGTAAPTLSEEMIATASAIAKSSGRFTVAHAYTKEGIRRAIMGGVRTVEHADFADDTLFKLMKEKGVAYCPTLNAVEATATYRGWKKGIDPDPARVLQKKKSFAVALHSGVTILMGGDVGVFAHGTNYREMELMVEYGMQPVDVLRSATSVNARVFGLGDKIGSLQKGLLADIIAVTGDPSQDIKQVEQVVLVMKDGKMIMRK